MIIPTIIPTLLHVLKCPSNKADWEIASKRLNCSSGFLKHRYHCVPDDKRSTLIELCYDENRILAQKGNCLELVVDSLTLNHVPCQKIFGSGCPDTYYESDKLYKFPKCLDINTVERCFTANPKCPNVSLRRSFPLETSTKPIVTRYFENSETATFNIGIPFTTTHTNSRDHNILKERNILIVFAALSPLIIAVVLVYVIFRKCRNRTAEDLNLAPCYETTALLQKVTDLNEACKFGNLELVEEILKEKTNVNVFDKNGQTPLVLASAGGYLEIVKVLLQNGADINLCDKSHTSPLFMSVDNGRFNVIQHLLSVDDIDVDVNDKTMRSPLVQAVHRGLTDVVKWLLDKGANINCCDKYGNFPLQMAIKEDHCEIIDELLNKGADINLVDKEDRTSLYHATLKGNVNIVKKLVELNADMNKCDKEGKSPLHLAATFRHNDIAQILLGTLDKCENVRNNASLHQVAADKDEDIVTVPLDDQYHINLEIRDDEGKTALYEAAHNGDMCIVKLLADKGANCSSCDNYGRSPLHAACINNHLDVVRYLIDEMKVDINLQDKTGKTAIYIAAENSCEEILQFLDLHIKEDIGEIINNSHGDRKGKSLLLKACDKGQEEVVKYLIKHNADVNKSDNKRNAPLHIAAKLGHYKIVKTLIEKKAKIDIKDAKGRTPLHRASSRGHPGIVRFLLENGADRNICDKNKKKPHKQKITQEVDDVFKEFRHSVKNVECF